MQLRIIGYLIGALLAAACASASDSTGDPNENLNGNALAERKKDGGECRPSAAGERPPCAKKDHGDKGKSDAGKGHDDDGGDDDDDDDDDDGGKGKK